MLVECRSKFIDKKFIFVKIKLNIAHYKKIKGGKIAIMMAKRGAKTVSINNWQMTVKDYTKRGCLINCN
ncbi:MAG: hypothetical protein U9O55_03385 [Patescibacteria group bacterium]|nr:hypothetical protein [Patescibacteria group bacterium]